MGQGKRIGKKKRLSADAPFNCKLSVETNEMAKE